MSRRGPSGGVPEHDPHPHGRRLRRRAHPRASCAPTSQAGCADAVKRGKVPPLEEAEFDWLVDLFAQPEPHRRRRARPRGDPHQGRLGQHALLGAALQWCRASAWSREQCFRVFERAFCFDTMEIGHPDYSYKPVKPIVALEADRRRAGAAHDDLSRSSTGRCPTSASTRSRRAVPQPGRPAPARRDRGRPRGPDADGRGLQGRHALRARGMMAEVGADGINFDTTASAGDAEFLAVLRDGRGAGRHHRPRDRGRHGGRVRARLPRRARVQGQAPRRHVAAPAGQGRRAGRRPPLRPGASTPTRARSRRGTWPAP